MRNTLVAGTFAVCLLVLAVPAEALEIQDMGQEKRGRESLLCRTGVASRDRPQPGLGQRPGHHRHAGVHRRGGTRAGGGGSE
jgi:hypothetical protein